ncbi:MAG: SDR family NAD(P)-dependent oxidoreductase, partial [Actinobacteria bacterium]|nr:SDR family NAD(P)-dependent oxidoreductase [Actinomycetota bacterium]
MPYACAVSLAGKTAIVTGASSGIGAATARSLREQGVRVAGGARRVDLLDVDVPGELDVTDAASCESFVEQAVAALGGLDILVNNAGLALGREPFDASTEEDEEIVL